MQPWTPVLRLRCAVELVPAGEGALFPDLEPQVFGRPIPLDGIVKSGKNRGARLSGLNSHVLAYSFRMYVESKEQATILQAAWDWGVTLLSPKRLAQGCHDDSLVALWILCKRGEADVGPGFFAGLPAGLEPAETWAAIAARLGELMPENVALLSMMAG